MSIKNLVLHITFSILIIGFMLKTSLQYSKQSLTHIIEQTENPSAESLEKESKEGEKLYDYEYITNNTSDIIFHNHTIELEFQYFVVSPPLIHIPIHFPPPNRIG